MSRTPRTVGVNRVNRVTEGGECRSVPRAAPMSTGMSAKVSSGSASKKDPNSPPEDAWDAGVTASAPWLDRPGTPGRRCEGLRPLSSRVRGYGIS